MRNKMDKKVEMTHLYFDKKKRDKRKGRRKKNSLESNHYVTSLRRSRQDASNIIM
jgi:hypothetical protein